MHLPGLMLKTKAHLRKSKEDKHEGKWNTVKLFTNSDAPDAKLGVVERSAYMLGNVGTALLNTVVASFVMFYYTDIVMLDPVIIGMIMLGSRLFDGVTDLIMGIIVDHTHSRFGRGRAWILRMCIPYAVCGILMMSVPINAASTFQYVYVFITYNLCNSLCLTAVYVPYNSMTCSMTSDPYERGLLGTFVMFGAVIGTMVVQSTIDAAAKAMGNTPAAWRNVAIIYAVCGAVLHLVCFFLTKERNQPVEVEGSRKMSFGEQFKAVMSNKYWLMAVGATFMALFVTNMVNGSGMYFAKGVLGDSAYYALIANAMSIAQLASLFVAFIPMKRFGKKNTFVFGLVITSVASLLQFFIGENIAMLLACNVLRGIGGGFGSAVLYGLVADTIDYGEWKTGYCASGIGMAALTFVTKVSGGISQSLIGFITKQGGYNPEAAVQTADAILSLKMCFTLIPMICCVATIVILSFYNLDKIFTQIQEELAARRQASTAK